MAQAQRPSPRPDAAGAPGPLYRWGRTAVRRRRRVALAWLASLVLLGVVGTAAGGEFSDQFNIPGVDSQRAFDLLEERFPAQAGDTAQVVVRAEAGVDRPAARADVDALLATVAGLPHVLAVASPYDTPGAVSADGRTAYATVLYDAPAADVPVADIERLIAAVDAANTGSLRVEAGGQIVQQAEFEPPGGETGIAVAAAVVVLLVAFGSVVAMGVPIVTAIGGLVAGFLGIGLAARFLDIATFTPAIAAMIGLGVGIDYALFVVTRYREGLARGLEVEEAVARAMDTAGRSVLFAGSVVVIALLGLVAVGIPFIFAFGVAASIMVALSILIVLTLLPALLGFAGRRIDRWRVPGLRRAEADGATFGYRVGRRIQRNPVAWTVAAAALLLTLAAPLLDLDLGFPGADTNPTTYHSRRATDLLREGFGPGVDATFLVAVERPGGVDRAQLDRLAEAVRGEEHVVSVAPPTVNEAGDTAVLSIVPDVDSQDDRAKALVDTLRNDTVPAVMGDGAGRAYVGGVTAIFVDLNEQLSSRTPVFIGIVVLLSFLLLAVVFRSVVVALKAAVMNLLSIGAAYGVVIAVFQWGWGASLIGLEETQPIAAFMPMFLFSILFGLSMDYEVFLLSRIREAWAHGMATRDAVVEGLNATARVITAAAAIMVVVFLSFVLTDDAITKQFGLGLATAILVDATVVRMILVPATMELLGEWNWWFPRPLERLVPRINVEGTVGPDRPAAQPAGD